MAGTNPSFDPAKFKEGVLFAMNMGLPEDTAERPTFKFKKTRTYPPGTRLDQDGRPLDPNVGAQLTQPAAVQVPVAVEFQDARPDEMPVGAIRATKAVLTLLDDDYELVKEAVEVELGGDRYVISYVKPPLGLFDVTVYQMVCFAVDES